MALKCETCNADLVDDEGICDHCFEILLDDLENTYEQHKVYQEKFQHLTDRRWMPGGGYRLKTMVKSRK